MVRRRAAVAFPGAEDPRHVLATRNHLQLSCSYSQNNTQGIKPVCKLFAIRLQLTFSQRRGVFNEDHLHQKGGEASALGSEKKDKDKQEGNEQRSSLAAPFKVIGGTFGLGVTLLADYLQTICIHDRRGSNHLPQHDRRPPRRDEFCPARPLCGHFQQVPFQFLAMRPP